jgi:hypothetical protein
LSWYFLSIVFNSFTNFSHFSDIPFLSSINYNKKHGIFMNIYLKIIWKEVLNYTNFSRIDFRIIFLKHCSFFNEICIGKIGSV